MQRCRVGCLDLFVSSESNDVPRVRLTDIIRSVARIYVSYRRIHMLFRSSSVKRGSLVLSSFEKIAKHGMPGPSAEVWIPVQENTADKALDQALVRSQERRLVMVSVCIGEIHMSA